MINLNKFRSWNEKKSEKININKEKGKAMSEPIYYIDSAGLNEGNRALAQMGGEECPAKKCTDGVSRSLWRLSNREKVDDFLRRAKREEWLARIFWAETREAKPRSVFAENLNLIEERFRIGRRPSLVKNSRSNAAAHAGT
ncbi:MAG: hypothetical protein P4L61_03170 [Candidatus Pacebacteria bacterium]|nr:hypothetical protein [Candidatus Paceibacterota bacterium]